MKAIQTELAPKAIGPYSQAVIHNGILYASGQLPLSIESGEIVGSNIQEQTEQAVSNIKGILKAAGTEIGKVLKTTCFLKDISDFPAFNNVYAAHFTSNPARSTVQAAALPKGALVEIEVTAEV
ncbi:MAG: Rid family detoxifying hydrolase [Deferribacteraceae bacterium]|jgi:2-iminobutanoate/2-iminopropanoate deaminase|nr:Rid family detoxifying hydrolase [Deferribacteraceae bacterium]